MLQYEIARYLFHCWLLLSIVLNAMSTIIIETQINAPPYVVFDLARDIDLHCSTASHSKERAVAGVTAGLIGLGESVTFEGIHLGLRHRLTARVTEYNKPHRFVDEMTRGPFKSLKHVHEFVRTETGTLMRDTIAWQSPFGVVGVIADNLVLKRHLRNFLTLRNAKLKAVAEAIPHAQERAADSCTVS